MNELPILDNTVFAFDARGVAKRFRHAAVFGALESLQDGETMRFVNDHDPIPLLQQIEQRYRNQVGIECDTETRRDRHGPAMGEDRQGDVRPANAFETYYSRTRSMTT